MKTIIFDIDGTLTNMEPIEKLTLLSDENFYNLYKEKKLPIPEKYPLVNWIIKNRKKYNFVYATAGTKLQTEYALKKLKILKYFDIDNSISKTNCKLPKITGVPFQIIKRKYSDCILVTDSDNDCLGAKKVDIEFIKYKHSNTLTIL